MRRPDTYALQTDDLREQHQAASAMIDRVLKLSENCASYDQAYCLALQVAKLASLLRVHFAQEDCTLYATLFDCGDPEVSRIALDYFQELGGLAEKLEMFAFRWCSADTIRAGFHAFRPELVELCGALARRIALENAYLYPLAESVLARRLAA
ncbi:MAG TPA: hemerythrin domain-containing protein [Sphingomicrobium sp.]